MPLAQPVSMEWAINSGEETAAKNESLGSAPVMDLRILLCSPRNCPQCAGSAPEVTAGAGISIARSE